MAPLKQAEIVLARTLYDLLCPGDVVLGDRLYGTYADLALVQAQGAFGLFRCHQSRPCEFDQGKRLGDADHLGVWHKPQKRPKAMTPEVQGVTTSLQDRSDAG
jgi:hypothetical protein